MKSTDLTLRNYHDLVRPELGRVLSALNLEIIFSKAEGDLLHHHDGNKMIQVADFLGGYGSTILGHNHPEILAVLNDCQNQKVPQHSQGSIKANTANLANQLNLIVQNKMNDSRFFVMTLANSGAEAVEISLKHALLQWQTKRQNILHRIKTSVLRDKSFSPDAILQFETLVKKIESLRPVLVALEKGFHGKTTGAVSLTENSHYRKMFPRTPIDVEFISDSKSDVLIDLIKSSEVSFTFAKDWTVSFNAIAGFIYEPIQGEGGIEEVSKNFLDIVYEQFKERKIPIICDEIQSGLFRTGKFLCSEWQMRQPDYILLGKSLGGGVAKISACLIAKDHYVDEFGWVHTSTFAEDDWSSAVASKTLEILSKQEESIVKNAKNFESQIFEKVAFLQEKYHGIIRKVKGRGFFIGIEFSFDEEAALPDFLQGLYEQGHATYVYLSYLLRIHRVRVGVTMSAPSTLRIEPSAFVAQSSVDQLIIGLDNLCQILSKREMLKLTQHLWNQEFTPEQLNVVSDKKSPIRCSRKSSTADNRKHIGFLTHILNAQQAQSMDKFLRFVKPENIDRFLKNYSNQASPFRYFQKDIRGKNGAEITLNLYGIMQPSSFFEDSHRRQDPRASNMVQEAVDLACADQMEYFGLGQFTSIVSENGLLLKSPKMPLTTGNSLTIAMTVNALKEIALKKGLSLSQVKVGIVGFTGNICNVLTQVLADSVSNFVLVHREPYRDSRKYQEAVDLLLQNSSLKKESLVLSHSIHDLKSCEIIVVGTNSSLEFITNECVRENAIILDVSVPSNVHPQVIARKDVSYLQGGLAQLPFDQRIDHPWVPLKGTNCFACMAETIVMGLLDVKTPYSLGRLNKKLVVDSWEMAQQVGIVLGDAHAPFRPKPMPSVSQ